MVHHSTLTLCENNVSFFFHSVFHRLFKHSAQSQRISIIFIELLEMFILEKCARHIWSIRLLIFLHFSTESNRSGIVIGMNLNRPANSLLFIHRSFIQSYTYKLSENDAEKSGVWFTFQNRISVRFLPSNDRKYSDRHFTYQIKVCCRVWYDAIHWWINTYIRPLRRSIFPGGKKLPKNEKKID